MSTFVVFFAITAMTLVGFIIASVLLAIKLDTLLHVSNISRHALRVVLFSLYIG